MTDWNFGDILETVEDAIDPAKLAFAHGERTITWGEAAKRGNRLARALQAAGLKPGDKVAHYMRNSPAYMETTRACFKGRFTHVNINYRYRPDEVAYIVENSDAAALVYDAVFRDTVAAIRDRLPTVKLYIEVGGGADRASFAEDFERLSSEGDASGLDIKRSGDDLLFLYTGGTTGLPKGVMWPHKALREIQLMGARKLGPAPETHEELAAAIKLTGGGAPFIPACPLMHGTGFFSAIGATGNGGAVVTLEGQSFDAQELWRAVDRHKVGTIAIVGEVFARPMLQALQERPGEYDVSSVLVIISSGVMWGTDNKRALLEFMPQTVMTDSFGASEGVGFGASQMTKDGEIPTAKFVIGDRCKVFDENDQPVEPGSGKPGIIAMMPPIPLGYYKDEAKTAKTFRKIGDTIYSVPGDWCTVEADGSLTLIGRGSASINTGGEKVFPEEVEEALKTHPSIEDALVVGLPDPTWGQAITAVVKLTPGFGFAEDELKTHVREKLAPYKTPKRILIGENVAMRAPNGKADYKAVLEFARAQ
ncbi:3-oxocholest-4-en-26-oate--CoA ligase [Alphaproteobacteria bacterium SO-S41]|nr:3-oxocholest-4-en-26-oate--CoA ligase [Alphaproteobacteria bacterium SO-S41]